MGYLNKRLQSFKYAINGLGHLFKDEPNARIHLVASILIVLVGLSLNLDEVEWLWISMAIAAVFITELINTSIENLADAITLERNNKIKKAKDMCAAAVLLSALFSILVAAIILVPKFFHILTQL